MPFRRQGSQRCDFGDEMVAVPHRCMRSKAAFAEAVRFGGLFGTAPLAFDNGADAVGAIGTVSVDDAVGGQMAFPLLRCGSLPPGPVSGRRRAATVSVVDGMNLDVAATPACVNRLGVSPPLPQARHLQ